MPASAIVGRGGELASIQSFLEEVERGPIALVLAGEPGIGKTILWEEGVRQARERFGRVLACNGVEAEASLSFAALADLVASVLDDVAPFLLPLRREALEVALLRAPPGETALDPRMIGLALLDILQLLAQQAPVIVAVDDPQWIDPASAGALRMAVRRLRHERVGVLSTLRQGPDGTPVLELAGSLRTEQLLLRTLGLPALHELLKSRLALDLTRPELVRVREASGGNPLFALELGRELVRRGTRPEPGKSLPIPGGLEALLGGRLSRLPGQTRQVLLAAAAAAHPTVDLVAAAHGDTTRAHEALAQAVDEGVVSLDGPRIRFTHPLLASICYEQALPWSLREVHRALASAVLDTEERARHLALAAEGPDAAVAAEIDAAAERAAARGAPAAAAELFELAAPLTVAADTASQRHLRFRAADMHSLAGDPERAGALFEELLEEVPQGVERSDALFGLARTRPADPVVFGRLLDEAIVEAGADDARCGRILGFRAQVKFVYSGPGGSLEDARKALERAERADDPALLAVAIARVGQVETYTLDITPGLLERGVGIEQRLDRALDFYNSPAAMLAVRRMFRDEPEPARHVFESAGTVATQRGDESERAWVLFYLMWLEWITGRWHAALDHITEAKELAEQIHDEFLRPQFLNQQAFMYAYLGDVERARATANEILPLFEQAGSEIHAIVCRSTLGHLELALGDLDAAGLYLRDSPTRLLGLGWNEPSHPLWPDTIETLVGLGELEQARSHLERYEGLARQVSRRTRANAARCRGLLAAAEGDLATAFASSEAALAELEALPYPLEYARTQLCLGSIRRKAKQKRLAREALELALAGFEQLGARLWAERARAELKRISGRRAAQDELTETEQRVAVLAAEARSNRQIAAELYMSVRTVEAHLSRIYRKLGIHSRTELSRRLDSPAGQTARAAVDAVKVQ